MALPLNRRKFLARTGALFAEGTAGFPVPSIAQDAPLKIGLLTVKTSPLAAGGFHLEEGITAFLKERSSIPAEVTLHRDVIVMRCTSS